MASTENQDIAILDTLPKWLRHNTEEYGNSKIAMYHKDLGIWNGYTWQDCYQHCKYFGLGLLSLGLERGDKVAIVGDNDPHWYWAEYAAQSVGGVVLGLFVDALPNEARYIIEHSDSKFAIAKDQEQVDKILNFAHDNSKLIKIIHWEKRGMWSYDDPLLISWDDVEELGKKYEEANPGSFEENIDKGHGDDYAVILYTSGTASLPKGAIHTHKTVIFCGKGILSILPYTHKDNYVSIVTPGYVGDQMFGVSAGLIAAVKINFPEKPETMMENIREVAPQFFMLSGRMWESLASSIMGSILNSTRLKKAVHNLFLPVGYKRSDCEAAGKKPTLLWRALYSIAYWLLFRQIKDRTGLSHIRDAFSAGGALSPDCLRFFRAIGIPMRQAYGYTELTPASGNLLTDLPDSDTVGRVAPGTEVRITDENEILAKSDGLFIGYYKEPEKTQSARGDGWFHSGDAGTINDRGQVVFWDRFVDMLRLRGGFMFPPQYIEGKLKFSPYIIDCVALGGENRDFVSAIVAIDFNICSNWAETHRIAYTTHADLSQKQEIIDIVRKDIERVNRSLPPEQRIKRFCNLYKQFDPDDAELTRTRKLRRGFVEDRYKELIEAIYSEQEEYAAQTTVVYSDGRTGTVRTNIKVVPVE